MECPDEVADIMKPRFLPCISHTASRRQQRLCLRDAAGNDIFVYGCTGFVLEQLTEMIFAEADVFGDIVQRKICRKIGRDVF